MRKNNLHFLKITFFLLLLTLSTACKQPHAALDISPSVGCLNSPRAALLVTWDVSSLGLEKSSIEVNSLGYPPKLWIREGASGRKETGAWADDGFTVTLRAMDGTKLARRTYVHQICESQ